MLGFRGRIDSRVRTALFELATAHKRLSDMADDLKKGTITRDALEPYRADVALAKGNLAAARAAEGASSRFPPLRLHVS